MRQTLGTLLQNAKNYCKVADEETTTSNLSSNDDFLTEEINNAIVIIESALRNYTVQEGANVLTTTDDQYYYYPDGVEAVESATMTIGGEAYPLRVIESQEQWNLLNQIDAGGTFPQFIHPRRHDFGVWPIPSEDDLVIAFNHNALSPRMEAEDYSIGTVSLTNGSATVTGAGDQLAFSADMVGRYLYVRGGNRRWYKITAYVDTTHLTLQKPYEGTTVSGATYNIGQSPEIPMELQHIPAHYAAAMWYQGPFSDDRKAQEYLNYFYTGDFNNSSRIPRMAIGGLLKKVNQLKALGRGNSRLVRRKGAQVGPTHEVWSIELTD